MNIAIVVSEFNEEVTSRMLAIAKEKADLMKLKISHISMVPGAYDMPIIVDLLLNKKDIDAVVTLYRIWLSIMTGTILLINCGYAIQSCCTILARG